MGPPRKTAAAKQQKPAKSPTKRAAVKTKAKAAPKLPVSQGARDDKLLDPRKRSLQNIVDARASKSRS